MVVVFPFHAKGFKNILVSSFMSHGLKRVGIGTLLRGEQTLDLEEPNCPGTPKARPQRQVSAAAPGLWLPFPF